MYQAQTWDSDRASQASSSGTSLVCVGQGVVIQVHVLWSNLMMLKVIVEMAYLISTNSGYNVLYIDCFWSLKLGRHIEHS